MAGRIDPRPRITVIQPVASRRVVLVDQQIGHAHLLQALRGDDAGHPAPDDEHPEAAWRADPARAPALGSSDPAAELLGEHRPVAVVDVLPDTYAQHRGGLLGRRPGYRRRLARLQVVEGPRGSVPDLRLDVVGQAPGVMVAQAPGPGRPVGRLQPAR